MAKYGFSYQGGKQSHADEIIGVLPKGKILYDLFAGGCAITHAALLSNKWESVIANDLQNTPQLFLDAISGKYKNEKRWISREQFHAEKMSDPYIRWIWSFGNDGKSYLFGKEIEPIKKAAHEYLFGNGYDGTATTRKKLINAFKSSEKMSGRFDPQQLERLERLQRLQRLQQLERLQRLEQLEQLEQRLHISAIDYQKVKIKPGAVVYCDPPYCHIKGYKENYYSVGFDSEAFYNWVRENKHPVYFSSSFAPDYFKIVWEKKARCRMNNKGGAGKKEVFERLYWNGK